MICYVLFVRRWSDAELAGKYNAKTPKQDSKRFNFITKTIHFAHLGTVYCLSMVQRIHKPRTSREVIPLTAKENKNK